METVELNLDVRIKMKRGTVHTFAAYVSESTDTINHQVITLIDGKVANIINVNSLNELLSAFMVEVNRIGEYNV